MEPTWQTDDGRVKLWLADCLDVLPTLEVGSVDAVVTDPPYGIDYQSARRTDKSQWKPKIANDVRPFVWWLPFTNAARCCLCFCRWDVQEAFRLAMGWAGWNVKAQIIWDRQAHGMGDLNGSPAPQHDVLWFATKEGYSFPGQRPKSVVRSMRLSGDALMHPNEKPEDLMEQLIADYVGHDEVCLDPMMGSGTTGVAAVRLGRRFLGCETAPKHYETAKARIIAELERMPLFEEKPTYRQKEIV